MNGKVCMVGKARGQKKGGELMASIVKDCRGVDFSMSYGVLWTGLNAEIAQKYICDSSELWEGVRLFLPTPSEVRSACISVRVRSAWRFLKKKRNKLCMQRKPLKRDSVAMPLFAFMA